MKIFCILINHEINEYLFEEKNVWLRFPAEKTVNNYEQITFKNMQETVLNYEQFTFKKTNLLRWKIDVLNYFLSAFFLALHNC